MCVFYLSMFTWTYQNRGLNHVASGFSSWWRNRNEIHSNLVSRHYQCLSSFLSFKNKKTGLFLFINHFTVKMHEVFSQNKKLKMAILFLLLIYASFINALFSNVLIVVVFSLRVAKKKTFLLFLWRIIFKIFSNISYLKVYQAYVRK